MFSVTSTFPVYSFHFPLPILIYIFLAVIGGLTSTFTLSVYSPFLFSCTLIVGADGVSTGLVPPPPAVPLSLLPPWPPPPVVLPPPVPPLPCQLPVVSPSLLIYTLSYPQLVFSVILFPSPSYISSTRFALAYMIVLSPTSNSPLYVCHEPFPTLYSFTSASFSYMIFTFVFSPLFTTYFSGSIITPTFPLGGITNSSLSILYFMYISSTLSNFTQIGPVYSFQSSSLISPSPFNNHFLSVLFSG